MSLAAVTVNYNAGPLLSTCIASLVNSDTPMQICVVDNGSTDGSIEMAQQRFKRTISIIETGQNLGFAKACNIGVAETQSDYVLFVNPDCEIGRSTLSRLLAFMDTHPEAAVASCVILNADGSEQEASRRIAPTPFAAIGKALGLRRLFRRLFGRKADLIQSGDPLPPEPVEVEVVSGAFMLVRRSAIEEVGPFDEGYFLHCEDLDWCMRFRQAGKKIYFVPDVSVIHHKGACSKTRPLFVQWHMHKGMARFYHKFFKNNYVFPVMWFIFAGIWIRFGALTVRHLYRSALHRNH